MTNEAVSAITISAVSSAQTPLVISLKADSDEKPDS